MRRRQGWVVPGLVGSLGCRSAGLAVELVAQVVVQVFDIFDAPARGVVMRPGCSSSASDSVVQVAELVDTPAPRAAMNGTGQCGMPGRIVLRRALIAVGRTALRVRALGCVVQVVAGTEAPALRYRYTVLRR